MVMVFVMVMLFFVDDGDIGGDVVSISDDDDGADDDGDGDGDGDDDDNDIDDDDDDDDDNDSNNADSPRIAESRGAPNSQNIRTSERQTKNKMRARRSLHHIYSPPNIYAKVMAENGLLEIAHVVC